MNAIEVSHLSKAFGEFLAVKDVSFSIPRGELFGLLGPNGAGKTTTLSILSTILSASKGDARIEGFDVSRDHAKVRSRIGIVFQDPSLDFDLTARENLDFHARLYGVPRPERAERIAGVLSLVELSDKANWLVKTFSGGMRRRLEIARGLLHHPSVLFLDEPTLGLDPQTRRRLWQYIKRLNKEERVTIILTTHYLEEADFLCDRIAVMDHGQIVALDSPANLKKGLKTQTLRVNSSDNEKLAGFSSQKIKKSRTVVSPEGVEFFVEGAEKVLAELFSFADRKKIVISEASIHSPTLEDVFVDLTGHSIRDEPASMSEQARNSMQYRGFVRR